MENKWNYEVFCIFSSQTVPFLKFLDSLLKYQGPADFYFFDQTHGLAKKLKFPTKINVKHRFGFPILGIYLLDLPWYCHVVNTQHLKVLPWRQHLEVLTPAQVFFRSTKTPRGVATSSTPRGVNTRFNTKKTPKHLCFANPVVDSDNIVF